LSGAGPHLNIPTPRLRFAVASMPAAQARVSAQAGQDAQVLPDHAG